MTATTKVKWRVLALAAGLGGIVLGQTDLAKAGTKWEWTVRIEGSSPNTIASGSLLDGRYAGQALDYIGCKYNSTGWLECFARQGLTTGASKVVKCIYDEPSIGTIAAVTGLNSASVLWFQLKSGGLCKTIEIWNESDFL
jgi:hypothetical protein